MKSLFSVCVYGTYDENILSNKVILDGIKKVYPPQKISFVHTQIPKGNVYAPEHLSLKEVAKRAWKRIYAQLVLLKQMRYVLRHDVILVLPFGLMDLLLLGIAKFFTNKKIIYVPQNSLYDLFVYAKGTTKDKSLILLVVFHLERFLMSIADIVVFTTKEEADAHKALLNLPNLKTFLIPLGAHDAIFYPRKVKKKKESVNILFYGEYNLAQGASVIVEAASLIKKQKHIFFTMIGEGRTKPEALALAERLKVTNITFKGWVTPEELTQYITLSDISLGMFHKDPLSERVIPNKVYQGLASKVCVISGKSNPALRAISDKKEAYFVEMDNPQALATAIIYLAKSSKKREDIANAGYKLFLKRFATEPIGKAFMNLINEVAI